jgi:hypothetical protein
MSTLGTTTAWSQSRGPATDSSQPNLPGFCPAVYPTRLAARLDCLSRTRHLLQQQAGTLDAHFQFLTKSSARAVPTLYRAHGLRR